MDIAGVIKNLLYRHNCVIIPGFGGLVADYAPAQIHPIQHIFLPPRKSIAFNRSLNSNDGLLIAEIARSADIKYEEAGLQLQHFVRQMESGLKNKGSVVLPSIGKFYYDIEKNLQFKAEEHQNYLLPSFGLDEFIAQPVMRREEVISALETSLIQAKKKKRVNWIALTLIAILLAIGSQVFFISKDNSQLNIQETGVYHFMSDIFSSIKSSMESKSVSPSEKRDTLIQIFIIQNSTPRYIDTAALVAEAIHAESIHAEAMKIPIEENTIVLPQPTTSLNTNGGEYYLIFGCFKGKNASLALIDQLKTKGVNAGIVIEDSYRRVGISGFHTKDEAVTAMRDYYHKGIIDVWVMKK